MANKEDVKKYLSWSARIIRIKQINWRTEYTLTGHILISKDLNRVNSLKLKPKAFTKMLMPSLANVKSYYCLNTSNVSKSNNGKNDWHRLCLGACFIFIISTYILFWLLMSKRGLGFCFIWFLFMTHWLQMNFVVAQISIFFACFSLKLILKQ